jgi:hypothetical protein
MDGAGARILVARSSHAMTMRSGQAILTVMMVVSVDSFGCYSALRPISDRAMIEGRRADQARVVLAAPFSFKHILTTYTLPAGQYAATMEDDSGVYFNPLLTFVWVQRGGFSGRGL